MLFSKAVGSMPAGGESVRPGDARGQAFFFARAQRDDFDFRVEGLPQRRKNIQLAEAGGVRSERRCQR